MSFRRNFRRWYRRVLSFVKYRMHITDLLTERTTDDLAAHEKAMEAYHLVSDYVNKGPGPDFNFDISDYGKFYGLDPLLVRFDRLGYAHVVVLIGLRNPRAAVMAGGVWRFVEALAG